MVSEVLGMLLVGNFLLVIILIALLIVLLFRDKKQEGSDLRSKENEYFVQDIGENIDVNVNFLYSNQWPMKLEVWPSEDGILRADPVGCYVMTKRTLREEKVAGREGEYSRRLEKIASLLDKSILISLVK